MIDYLTSGDWDQNAGSGLHDIVLNFLDGNGAMINGFESMFQTGNFPMETSNFQPIDKLGNIDYKLKSTKYLTGNCYKNVWVVNVYAVLDMTKNSPYGIELDYDALRLCFRKINMELCNHSLAFSMEALTDFGGDQVIIEEIAKQEFNKMRVRIITSPKMSV